MRLLVRQFGQIVGTLESTPDRGVVFRYDPGFLTESGARALSLSLPLREATYSQAAAMPFFAGLLPDGELRRRVADHLHVSENSTLKLLDALGGECAGTVSISGWEVEEEGQREPDGKVQRTRDDAADGDYRELSRDELASIVLESQRRPLLTPRDGARLSLAGAQDKIPLLHRDNRWWLPLGDSPSSHILKPSSPSFPDLAANEFFCMRLAAAVGLRVPRVELEVIGRHVLIVDRYDRDMASGGSVERIHQEDFCQALGIMPDRKYEADGGPGFPALAKTIRQSCADPLADIEAFMRAALFNLLIGNCDAHGKNFSILYHGPRLGLAPFYDIVSTTVHPELSGRLSMRMGKEYRADRIGRADLELFARDVGVRPRLTMDILAELVRAGSDAWNATASLPELDGHAPLIEGMRLGWDGRAGTALG